MRFPGLILFCLVSVAGAQVSSGGDFTLEKTVISNGGGRMSDPTNTIVISATTGQSAAGAAKTGSPFSHPVGFWTSDLLLPTAAGVTVSGRLATHTGMPIANALLSMMLPDGVIRTARTNTFGRFSFDDVAAGSTYVVSVSSRRYVFHTSPMVVEVMSDLSDLSIIGSPR